MNNASLVRGFAIALAVFIGSSAAVAGECRFGACFGAVGAGDRGYAAQVQNLNTAQSAMARLETACRGKCSTMEVFHSGCGVIVQGGAKRSVHRVWRDDEGRAGRGAGHLCCRWPQQMRDAC